MAVSLFNFHSYEIRISVATKHFLPYHLQSIDFTILVLKINAHGHVVGLHCACLLGKRQGEQRMAATMGIEGVVSEGLKVSGDKSPCPATLLLIVGEPFTVDQKDLILERIVSGE